MTAVIVIIIVIVAIAAACALWAVSANNSLVRARNRCDNAEQQVSAQLQRRFDLIPNLVETVKGYAKHESDTLRAVTEARSAGKAALASGDTAGAVKADADATRALGIAINAVSEAYPELKADKNFASLQDELARTEDKVTYARQSFNDVVMDYNNKVESFPSSIVAGMRGFGRRKGFAVTDEAARQAPKVRF